MPDLDHGPEERTANHLESSIFPASEHGRGFPPFDAQNFPSQLFWLVLIFVALYLLMSKLALPRIGSILEARRRHIEDDLAEAQRLKLESDAAIVAYETALAEARARGQTLASETQAKAAAAARLAAKRSRQSQCPSR